MGAIELVEGVGIALLWLLGAAVVLLAALSLPPVSARVRVDPLHFDEEGPWGWKEVPLEVDVRALFGALHFRFERSGGALQAAWRFLPIAGAAAAKGGLRESEPPGELGARLGRDRPEDRPAPRPGRGAGRAESARRRPKRALSLNEWRRLLPEVRWLFAQARRRMKLEVLGELVYGFSDPFATALVHSATAALPPLPRLRLHPDYSRGTLRGGVELRVRAYPWQAALLLARACLRPNVRSLWWPRLRRAVKMRRAWPMRRKHKEVVAS